jgi:hypothetical protein
VVPEELTAMQTCLVVKLFAKPAMVTSRLFNPVRRLAPPEAKRRPRAPSAGLSQSPPGGLSSPALQQNEIRPGPKRNDRAVDVDMDGGEPAPLDNKLTGQSAPPNAPVAVQSINPSSFNGMVSVQFLNFK